MNSSTCAYAIDRPCLLPAHVVLFASPTAASYEFEFAGQIVRRGQMIAFCLKHGGEIYDSIQGRGYPAWLAPYAAAHTLPVTSLADHVSVSTAYTPKRDKPWTKRPPRDSEGRFTPPRDRQRRSYERA